MSSTTADLDPVSRSARFDLDNSLRDSLFARVLVSRTAKRVLDVVLSSVGLILLSPIFLLACLLIKLTDRGPIFYLQTRIGKDGRPFRFLKFRSMVVQAHCLKDTLQAQNDHGSDSVTFKLKNDPRVTWIGRILRRTSIDELPQFLNVLFGDMSLVGPRPGLPEEVARYSPYEFQRLHALPGITCLWQVNGRAHLPFADQVRLDLEYIEKRTLWLDIVLLLKTVPAVLSCRGAY